MCDKIQTVDMALFAGGCFWCMETAFEKTAGVVSVTSGYAGGTTSQPSYEDYDQAGHIEVVQVHYDPQRVGFDELLALFWRQINPTDGGGQFADRGHAYSSTIFYYTAEQRRQAEVSKAELGASGRFEMPIVTPILAAPEFFPAEDYHQDYSKKNGERYHTYRMHSGRESFLLKFWADPIEEDPGVNELKEQLTPLQYRVTQEDGTEPAFQNEYWNNKEAGIYVDIISGEVLFSSLDKYDSGTGWPSFTRAQIVENVVRVDADTFYSEVRSGASDSHLGHVFSDGPLPTGERYCINSAALRFIPLEALEQEGYGEYLRLFE